MLQTFVVMVLADCCHGFGSLIQAFISK